MIRHFVSRQFFAFLLVGGTSALLHWLSRIVLSIWLPFPRAVVLAYGVGMLVAFILNGLFVFPAATKPWRQQARDFSIVNLLCFPLVWGVALALDLALESIGVPMYRHELAHGIAVAIPAVVTFLAYKFFVFGNS